MNKLTDTEIVKALECCNGFEGCPDECPYHSNEFEMKIDCLDEKEGIMAKALDLINRKNAEIENLKGDIDLYKKIMHNLSKELEESE